MKQELENNTKTSVPQYYCAAHSSEIKLCSWLPWFRVGRVKPNNLNVFFIKFLVIITHCTLLPVCVVTLYV